MPRCRPRRRPHPHVGRQRWQKGVHRAVNRLWPGEARGKGSQARCLGRPRCVGCQHSPPHLCPGKHHRERCCCSPRRKPRPPLSDTHAMPGIEPTVFFAAPLEGCGGAARCGQLAWVNSSSPTKRLCVVRTNDILVLAWEGVPWGEPRQQVLACSGREYSPAPRHGDSEGPYNSPKSPPLCLCLDIRDVYPNAISQSTTAP